jgi:hypothetical protein
MERVRRVILLVVKLMLVLLLPFELVLGQSSYLK